MKYDMEEIGKRIKRFRKERGFSQRKLAQMTGCASHATISDLETGRGVFNAQVLAKIARTLDVNFDTLIGTSIDLHPFMSVEQLAYYEFGQEIMPECRNFSEDEIQRVKEAAKKEARKIKIEKIRKS